MSMNYFRLFFSVILVLALLLIAPAHQPARAAGPWYVSTTGDDSNDCLSATTPCATINGAIGKASGGDRIYVAEGTYTGTADEVVLIDRDIILSGGWDAGFSGQGGISIIDAEIARRGLNIHSGLTVTVDHFTIENGSFPDFGGGIYNAGASLTVSSSNIINNAATESGGSLSLGGGIHTSGTTLLSNTVISGNTATQGGGIYNSNYDASGTGNPGVLTLQETVISANTAAAGGGIFNGGFGSASMVINSSLVSGNTSGSGAGINNEGSSTVMTLNNSTISSNFGVGIVNQTPSMTSTLNNVTVTANQDGGITNISGDLILKNSIVAGHAGSDCFGGPISSGYNLVGNVSNCGFTAITGDLINIDPQLGPLQANGGPTLTHTLLPLSPAIDSANPTGCTDQQGTPLTTDQRGVTRPQGAACDIGAFEFSDISTGPATVLAVLGGSGQQTALSQPFPRPLRAVALDSQGNRVTGVTVDFSAPETGPSGIFADTTTNTTTAITDAGGAATAAAFTANDQAGAYVVTASASGLDPVDFHLEQIDRPANDNLANAEEILSLPFSDVVDSTNATYESGEPGFCGTTPETQSVWYVFTPATDVVVSADMFGSSLSDASLSVFQQSGPGFDGLSFIGGSCSGGPFVFTARTETAYYLQSLSVSGGAGALHLNLQEVSPPPNDNFAAAEIISAVPFTTTVDITGATTQQDESQFCTFMERTVWHRFVPSAAMTLRADAQGGIGTNVNIYRASGPGITDLQFVGCATPFGAANFSVDAGATYYFQAGPAFGETGTVQFSLSEVSTITGRVVDAVTGAPLTGGDPTFTFVILQRVCGDGCLEYVNSQQADGEGRFSFDSYYFGAPLSAGAYQLDITAFSYEPGLFGPFEFTGDNLDVGDLPLEALSTGALQIAIDIKPGSDTNPINRRSRGLIAVAILSTPDFHALSMVDRSSLTFGRTGDELSVASCSRRGKDVNGDGLLDLVCHFKTQMTGFQLGDTEGVLKGETLDDRAIEGRDLVRIFR